MEDQDKTPKAKMIRTVLGFCKDCKKVKPHTVKLQTYKCVDCGRETIVHFFLPKDLEEP